jgi:fructose-1,6-bisphosphatase
MSIKDNSHFLNRYFGKKWLRAKLPQQSQPWIMGPYNKSVKRDKWNFSSISQELKEHMALDSWQWPKRVIYFFSDMHADTDAFIDSLIASGGIIKTGPKDKNLKLTKEGKKARFILGGDCFDKGPSTLRLLRMIKILIDKGADVTILAGNHDTRTLVGMLSLSRPASASTEHFFVRMGLKPLPLFKEIYENYFNTKRQKKHKKYKTLSNKSSKTPVKKQITLNAGAVNIN